MDAILGVFKRTGSASAPQSSLSQPPPRFAHCAASVGGKVLMRGGCTKDRSLDDLRSCVHSYDPLLEAWGSARATGELLPGLYRGACTAAGEELFYYGGYEGFQGSIRSSALSRFTPSTHTWSRLCKGSLDGPMAKTGCGMVSCGEGQLCVFAGHGLPTGPVQPGSTLIKDTRFTDGSGWTNELHLYDINGGVWFSPALTGTRPCPRSNFTLTAINNHQAIGFGGYNGEQGVLNDCFMVDFLKMEWSELDIKGELPVPRNDHAACCLNFGDDHPQLLVTGGRNRNNKVLDDTWILDVHARTWRKVDLPSGSLPRAHHSLTAIALGEGVTEAVSFGGFCKVPENAKSDADLDPIDETTVMRFESSPASADSPSKWRLTDVANSRQLGSKERVTAFKTALIGELCMRHHHTTATLQPQATSPSHEAHTLRETQRALRDSRQREQVLEQRAQEAERRLQDAEELTHQLQQFADASDHQEREATTRAEEAATRAQQHETRAQEAEEATARVQTQLQEESTRASQAERNAQEATARAEEYQTQAREATAMKETQAAEAENRVQQLQQAVEEANQNSEARVRAVETALREEQETILLNVEEEHERDLRNVRAELEVRLVEVEQQSRQFQRRALEAEQRVQQLTTRTHEAEERSRQHQTRAHTAEERLRQSETRMHEAEQRAHTVEDRLRQSETRMHEAEQNLQQAEERSRACELRAQTAEETQHQLQQAVDDTTQRLELSEQRARETDERLQQAEAQWAVQRNDIDLTEEEVGRGGWAAVKVAVFRGTRVAAKCFYRQIVTHHNRRLFRREMNMASRIRHPNLVQFVGATLEGEMIILTELMPTSLRAVLEQRAISLLEITTISLGVARALNYLHLMRPDPIVHRDISSANVLLEPGPNNSWKAKVSDYGSVNQLQHAHSEGAGNATYAAPEANTANQQTPKMDIFSFGVLLIEMCISEFPDTIEVEREAQIRSIPHAHFVALIRRCLQGNKDNRPSASDLITELSR